jgi:hypothetical protein
MAGGACQSGRVGHGMPYGTACLSYDGGQSERIASMFGEVHGVNGPRLGNVWCLNGACGVCFRSCLFTEMHLAAGVSANTSGVNET